MFNKELNNLLIVTSGLPKSNHGKESDKKILREEVLFDVLNNLQLLLPDLNRLIAEYDKIRIWTLKDFNNTSGGVAAKKRLLKELNDFEKEPLEGMEIEPIDGDIFTWQAILIGPLRTPYERGRFKIKIRSRTDYPFQPPRMEFTTKIYHCNINREGLVSYIYWLRDNWSPALNIPKVLLNVMSLLQEPDLEQTLEPEICKLYIKNRAEHDRNAREWTQKYAS